MIDRVYYCRLSQKSVTFWKSFRMDGTFAFHMLRSANVGVIGVAGTSARDMTQPVW